MEVKQKKERTLKDFVDILIPKIWIIAVVSVLFAAVAFVYSTTRVDTYTSGARFLVRISSEDDGANSLYNNEIAQNNITNYAVVVDGIGFREDVVADVEAEYGIKLTTDQFKSMFQFVKSTDAPVFTIRVTHTDPDVAFSVATVVKDNVLSKIANMEGNTDLVEVVDPPSTPKSANSKNEFRNALIAFLIGAVLSAATILIISLADVVVRDKKKLEDRFDLPILGVIPYHDIDRSLTGKSYYGGYKNASK